MNRISLFQSQFNPRYAEFVSTKIAEVAQTFSDSWMTNLFEHLTPLVSGGKRVRPYIAKLGYDLAGGENEKDVMDLGISLELFHTFCLIHDDIIDQAATRRHVQTIHERSREQLIERVDHKTAKHIGYGQAMLIGDLVFDWARGRYFDLSRRNPDISDTFWREQSAMVQEVVIGQMIDVDLMSRKEASANQIDTKMNLKTASYTFTRPLRMGIRLARGNGDKIAFADAFGKSLGLAFQIQDDMLDIIGSNESTGKERCTDIEEGQHTTFSNHIFLQGSPKAQMTLARAFGSRLSEAQKDELVQLFQESGAINRGEELIQKHLEDARFALGKLDVSPESKVPFEEFIDMISTRTS